MPALATVTSSAAAAPGRRAPSLRALILPREHGSWSLALEPLALGLVAAPSGAGGALAIAGLAMFLARRPLQACRRGDPRRGRAALVLLGFALLGTAGFLVGLGAGAQPVPALLALSGIPPAGAAFAWFDRRKAGREAVAELFGATCFAFFPAAIALQAGRDVTAAVALAGFALARSLTSILPIRTLLRRRKGQSASALPAAVAAVLAVAAFGFFAVRGGAWLPAAWTGGFALRTAWLLGPLAPAWSARRIGTCEMLLGCAAVVSTALALR